MGRANCLPDQRARSECGNRNARRNNPGACSYHRRLGIEILEARRVLSAVPNFSQMIVFGDSLSDTGHIPAFVAQFDGYTESNGRFTSTPRAVHQARAWACGTKYWPRSWALRRLRPLLADRIGRMAGPKPAKGSPRSDTYTMSASRSQTISQHRPTPATATRCIASGLAETTCWMPPTASILPGCRWTLRLSMRPQQRPWRTWMVIFRLS